jgi:ribosomal protein S27E
VTETAGVELPCPVCGGSMDVGVVVGRSPGVKFKESKGILGDLGGIPLTTGVFNHSVDALRCPSCGTVVIPGNRPGG